MKAAVPAPASTGSALIAETIVDGWTRTDESIAVGDGATAQSATIVETYTNKSGNPATKTVTVSESTSEAYATAAQTVSNLIGTTYMGATYVALDTSSITGVQVTAAVAQGSSSCFLNVVMFYNGYMFDASGTYIYLKGTDQSAAALQVVTAIATAMKAAVPAPGPEPSTPESEAAAAFAQAYAAGDDGFGSYTASGANATAVVKDAARTVTFTTYADQAAAKAAFDTLVASVNTAQYTSDDSWATVTVESYPGLDGAYAFMRAKTMGGKYATSLFIVAYNGNMVADGITVNQYRNTGAAPLTEDLVTTFFAALKVALPVVVTPESEAAAAFAQAYAAGDDGFGSYTASGANATAVVKDAARTVTFTTYADQAAAKAAFDTLVASVNTAQYTSDDSWATVTVESYPGLDGAYAFMRAKTMGGKYATSLFIVAYNGNMVADGITVNQYRNTGAAPLTEDLVTTFFAALKVALPGE